MKHSVTMSAIQVHPWFKLGLPDGAGVMNSVILRAPPPPGAPRQAPDEIRALVRVSVGGERKGGDRGEREGGSDRITLEGGEAEGGREESRGGKRGEEHGSEHTLDA